MTPCIRLLKKYKTSYKIHKYEHDPSSSSYGEEAAQKLDAQAGQIFKTLVIETEKGEFASAIIPVEKKLSLKNTAKALNTKKVSMAQINDVEKTTGYILGGVSPLGQKKRLKTIIDNSAENYETILVSAGKRGLDIEISPFDLQKLLNGEFKAITV